MIIVGLCPRYNGVETERGSAALMLFVVKRGASSCKQSIEQSAGT